MPGSYTRPATPTFLQNREARGPRQCVIAPERLLGPPVGRGACRGSRGASPGVRGVPRSARGHGWGSRGDTRARRGPVHGASAGRGRRALGPRLGGSLRRSARANRPAPSRLPDLFPRRGACTRRRGDGVAPHHPVVADASRRGSVVRMAPDGTRCGRRASRVPRLSRARGASARTGARVAPGSHDHSAPARTGPCAMERGGEDARSLGAHARRRDCSHGPARARPALSSDRSRRGAVSRLGNADRHDRPRRRIASLAARIECLCALGRTEPGGHRSRPHRFADYRRVPNPGPSPGPPRPALLRQVPGRLSGLRPARTNFLVNAHRGSTTQTGKPSPFDDAAQRRGRPRRSRTIARCAMNRLEIRSTALRAAACILALLTVASPASGQWPACGVDLSRGPSGQYSPQILSNGTGGAIVVWYDNRNVEDPLAYPDIFSRAISASGTPLGTIDGTPICTAPREQSHPK